MALRFISHKEIAYRQLLGMLRTPPVAVMGYYSNLFLSARFVFGEDPDKIKHLEKEIRRVECMVGIWYQPDSYIIQEKLAVLARLRAETERDIERLESLYESTPEEGHAEIEQAFQIISRGMVQMNNMEYTLIFMLLPMMNLKMIEIYMDNNFDLKSWFRENGNKVTQMQINAELEKIKIWVYQEAVQMMPYIRFTKLE